MPNTDNHGNEHSVHVVKWRGRKLDAISEAKRSMRDLFVKNVPFLLTGDDDRNRIMAVQMVMAELSYKVTHMYVDLFADGFDLAARLGSIVTDCESDLNSVHALLLSGLEDVNSRGIGGLLKEMLSSKAMNGKPLPDNLRLCVDESMEFGRHGEAYIDIVYN